MNWEEAKKLALEKVEGPILENPLYVSQWVAYKDGAVVGTSDVSYEDAKHRFKSKLIERIDVNKEARTRYFDQLKAIEAMAVDFWYAALREEWIGEISEELFLACYSEAYDRAHSSGYDEIASEMRGVVDFALRVIKHSSSRNE